MLPDQSIGPIIAASIAAVIAIIGIVTTRYQKTTELRHSWMEDLRDDIAKYISSAASLVELRRENNGAQLSFDKEEPYFSVANEAAVKIRLNLRLMDENELEIQKNLEELLDSFAEEKIDHEKYRERTAILCDSVADVLKNEWRKIKMGPAIIRVLWWIAMVVLFTSVVAIGLHYFSKSSV